MTRHRYPWELWLGGGLYSVEEAEAPHLASALRTKAARVGRRVRTRRVVDPDGTARVLFQFEPETGVWAPALDRAGSVEGQRACVTCGRSDAPQVAPEAPAAPGRPEAPATEPVDTEATEV